MTIIAEMTSENVAHSSRSFSICSVFYGVELQLKLHVISNVQLWYVFVLVIQ